jgi:hypothetical protein
LRDRLVEIIDHWSRVTGRNLKARPIVATAPTPSPAGAIGAAGNGSQPRVAMTTGATVPVGGA